jgi:hypothetical protein
MRSAAVASVILCAALAGCSENVADPEGPPARPLSIISVSTDLLIPGSRLIVVGEGFAVPPAGETAVRLVGTFEGQRVDHALRPIEGAPTRLDVRFDDGLAGTFGGPGAFDGTLEVSVATEADDAPRTAEFPVAFRYAPALEAVLTGVQPESVAPGEMLTATGQGFIDGDEGRTELRIEGTFTPSEAPDGEPPAARRVDPAALALSSRLGRTEGDFYLRPAVLGLDPGTFEGTATLRTTDRAGQVRESAPTTLRIVQEAPRFEGITPLTVARGRVMDAVGRGFLPNDPAARTATVLRADGVFVLDAAPDQPVDYTGPRAFLLSPDVWLDNSRVRLVVHSRYTPGIDRSDPANEPLALAGLGARAGVFTGQLILELVAGEARRQAPPVPAELIIEPTIQWVHLRYLPGFEDGLRLFGLEGMADAIKARVAEVCARDYAGFRVYFQESAPADQAEYVTVEIGGRDPNGLGLFGLDNTPNKDHGNLRLDETLGGVNAEAAASGQLPFGGVFVASFLTLSPGHETPSAIADPRFDAVFRRLSPAIGGEAARPIRLGETPPAERRAEVDEAVRVLGNIIGSTITHEVGHAVGLAAVEGDVHNPTDTNGGLMDRGANRPFAERAEIDGTPPARFLGDNRRYLEARLLE